MPSSNLAFSPYICARDLEGHRESVNAVAFAPDGRYLASGGDDFVLFVFDVDTGKVVHKIRGMSPITALAWCSRSPKLLYVGFGNGQVLRTELSQEDAEGFYLPRVVSDSPVEALVSDPHCLDECIVVCAGSRLEIWKKVMKDGQDYWKFWVPAIPKSVRDTYNLPCEARSAHILEQDHSLAVSYLNHGIVGWSLSNYKFLWQITPRSRRIGRSALSGSGTLVVSNLYDGFDVYDLTTRAHTRTFKTSLVINVPLPVVLAQDDSELVMGSSCGEVRVLDPLQQHELQVLDHRGHMIQSIAYQDVGEVRLLATATSESGNDTVVKIWQRNLPAVAVHPPFVSLAHEDPVRPCDEPSPTTSISPIDVVQLPAPCPPQPTVSQASQKGGEIFAPPVFTRLFSTGAWYPPFVGTVLLSLCTLLAISTICALVDMYGHTYHAPVGRLVGASTTGSTSVAITAAPAINRIAIPARTLASIVEILIGATIAMAHHLIGILIRYICYVQGGGVVELAHGSGSSWCGDESA